MRKRDLIVPGETSISGNEVMVQVISSLFSSFMSRVYMLSVWQTLHVWFRWFVPHFLNDHKTTEWSSDIPAEIGTRIGAVLKKEDGSLIATVTVESLTSSSTSSWVTTLSAEAALPIPSKNTNDHDAHLPLCSGYTYLDIDAFVNGLMSKLASDILRKASSQIVGLSETTG